MPEDEDRTMVKKSMFRQHKEKLGNYIFDGTMLFSPNRYVVGDSVMNLTSSRQEVQISLFSRRFTC